MDYTCRNTIIQNMRDFGCEEAVIADFMKCYDHHDQEGQKKIIKHCRIKKMDELHQKQKEIDLLDFLVYQLEQCNCYKK